MDGPVLIRPLSEGNISRKTHHSTRLDAGSKIICGMIPIGQLSKQGEEGGGLAGGLVGDTNNNNKTVSKETKPQSK